MDSRGVSTNNVGLRINLCHSNSELPIESTCPMLFNSPLHTFCPKTTLPTGSVSREGHFLLSVKLTLKPKTQVTIKKE